MTEDKPDTGLLIALSQDAAAQEQKLVDEVYTDQWRDIKLKGRYSRYWDGKNKVLE